MTIVESPSSLPSSTTSGSNSKHDDVASETAASTKKTTRNETASFSSSSASPDLLSFEDFLERGKKVLDSSLSSWTVGVGDAGLDDLQTALQLSTCSSSIQTTHSKSCAELHFLIGRALQILKRWPESSTSFERALQILESTVGRYHFSTVGVYVHLGQSYDAMQHFWSRSKYRTAERIEMRLHGGESMWASKMPMTTTASKSLKSEWEGDFYAKLGDLESARRAYKEAIMEELEFGVSTNANLVLLNRKMVEPGIDVFGYSTFCSSSAAVLPTSAAFCSRWVLCKGDSLYLDGDYMGAIEAYQGGWACGQESSDVELDTWSGCILFGWLVVVIVGCFRMLKAAYAIAWNLYHERPVDCEGSLSTLMLVNAILGVRDLLHAVCVMVYTARKDYTPMANKVGEGSAQQDSLSDESPDAKPLIIARNEMACEQELDHNMDGGVHVGTSSSGEDVDCSDDCLDAGADIILSAANNEDMYNQGLMDSACESLGAVLARDSEQTSLDWSFQPK